MELTKQEVARNWTQMETVELGKSSMRWRFVLGLTSPNFVIGKRWTKEEKIEVGKSSTTQVLALGKSWTSNSEAGVHEVRLGGTDLSWVLLPKHLENWNS